MGYITLGKTDQLQIKIPTKLTTNWADELKKDFLKVLVEHDHSGNGKGVLLKSDSLEPNSLSGLVFRLDNDQWLRARNAADTADINVIKVTADDKVLLGGTEIVLGEGATSALSIDSSNITLNNDSLTINELQSNRLASEKAFTLAPGSTHTLITATEGPVYYGGLTIEYVIFHAGKRQVGTLLVHRNSAAVADEFVGFDHGFLFSINSAELVVDCTTATSNVSIKFVEIRR